MSKEAVNDQVTTDHAFLYEQYRALRTESMERTKLDYQSQRNGGLTIIAALTFASTKGLDHTGWIVVSVVIAVIAAITMVQQARHKFYGKKIGKFCKNLELRLIHQNDRGENNAVGWEHFIDDERSKDGALASDQYIDDGSFFSNLRNGKLSAFGRLSLTVTETLLWMAVAFTALIVAAVMSLTAAG